MLEHHTDLLKVVSASLIRQRMPEACRILAPSMGRAPLRLVRRTGKCVFESFKSMFMRCIFLRVFSNSFEDFQA